MVINHTSRPHQHQPFPVSSHASPEISVSTYNPIHLQSLGIFCGNPKYNNPLTDCFLPGQTPAYCHPLFDWQLINPSLAAEHRM